MNSLRQKFRNSSSSSAVGEESDLPGMPGGMPGNNHKGSVWNGNQQEKESPPNAEVTPYQNISTFQNMFSSLRFEADSRILLH